MVHYDCGVCSAINVDVHHPLLAVVKLLVDSDVSKKTIHTKADNGSLPLHTAVRYGAPVAVVQLLLENNEQTLLETGYYDQLPLHVACRNGATPDVVQLLLDHDEIKVTVMQEDNVGRLPIHLALLHTTENQIDVVRLLLQGMLCGRIERKGLDLWKVDMKNMLDSMQTHERDFTTRDKLDMACEVITQFIDRVYTLDKCIRSGADVIVRDVMPFLEMEPVEELVQKLREYR